MPELHLLKLLFRATSAKRTIYNAQLALFWCKSDSDLMHILVGYFFSTFSRLVRGRRGWISPLFPPEFLFILGNNYILK